MPDQQPDDDTIAAAQRAHWQDTYAQNPLMYGMQPSEPARHAARTFRAAGARTILELGAGHGRDALFFTREGFTVHATDFSPTGLEQLAAAAQESGLANPFTTTVHDVGDPLPLPDASIDAVYAHMLLCMALSTQEIRAAMNEVQRVLCSVQSSVRATANMARSRCASCGPRPVAASETASPPARSVSSSARAMPSANTGASGIAQIPWPSESAPILRNSLSCYVW